MYWSCAIGQCTGRLLLNKDSTLMPSAAQMCLYMGTMA